MTSLLVTPEELAAAEVAVEGDAHRHLFRSLRLGPGDRVRLADGAGRARWAEVVEVDRRSGLLRVGDEAPAPEPAVRVHLLVAAPKKDRASWLVEKATELGVAAVRLLETERTPREFGEGTVRRLERVAAAAFQQCGRGRLPELSGTHPWNEVPALLDALDPPTSPEQPRRDPDASGLPTNPEEPRRDPDASGPPTSPEQLRRDPDASGPPTSPEQLHRDPDASGPPASPEQLHRDPDASDSPTNPEEPRRRRGVSKGGVVPGTVGPTSPAARWYLDLDPEAVPAADLVAAAAPSAALLVGPEGGWTDAERADLRTWGCRPALLGPTVLRVETAALAGAALLLAAEGSLCGPASA